MNQGWSLNGMMNGDKTDLPPSMIYIDKEGNWYYRGAEMIRRDFVQLFYRCLSLEDRGRYVMTWNEKRSYVEVEDTAYVVWGVALVSGAGKKEEQFLLHLACQI